MLMLALELSTKRGSVALVEAGQDFRLVDEVEWEAPQARSEQVFAAIMDLLRRQGLQVSQVEVFALGRGPGGFSGIRMAVTAAQAFALPAGRRVIAVSSGAALAAAVRKEHPGRPIAVAGDARRDTWWWGLFSADGTRVRDWSAEAPAKVMSQLPPDALAISPDWDRLAPQVGADARWLHEACFPRARAVAELAANHLRNGEAGEVIEPIYLHPAV